MEIELKTAEKTRVYALHPELNINFGDNENFFGETYDTLGRITSEGNPESKLKNVRDEFADSAPIDIRLLNDGVEIYSVSVTKIIYLFSRLKSQDTFVESLIFVG